MVSVDVSPDKPLDSQDYKDELDKLKREIQAYHEFKKLLVDVLAGDDNTTASQEEVINKLQAGQRSVHIAVRLGNPKLLVKLLGSGHKHTDSNKRGWTAIKLSASLGETKCLETLWNKNGRDSGLLHYAAANDQEATARWLLKHGRVDRNTQGFYGDMTPAEVATKAESNRVAAYLKDSWIKKMVCGAHIPSADTKDVDLSPLLLQEQQFTKEQDAKFTETLQQKETQAGVIKPAGIDSGEERSSEGERAGEREFQEVPQERRPSEEKDKDSASVSQPGEKEMSAQEKEELATHAATKSGEQNTNETKEELTTDGEPREEPQSGNTEERKRKTEPNGTTQSEEKKNGTCKTEAKSKTTSKPGEEKELETARESKEDPKSEKEKGRKIKRARETEEPKSEEKERELKRARETGEEPKSDEEKEKELKKVRDSENTPQSESRSHDGKERPEGTAKEGKGTEPVTTLTTVEAKTKVKVMGLPNLNQTCYMNCVLQCLYHTQPLYQHLLLQHSSTFVGSRGVVGALRGVVNALALGHGSWEAMVNMKTVAGEKDTLFQDSLQKEAHDFLSLMLEWLHTELAKGKEEESVISELFHGGHENTIVCPRTKTVLCTTTEHFTNLSLVHALSRKASLQDLVKQNYRTGCLEWPCDECGEEQHECERESHITKLPPVLIIHISRNSDSRSHIKSVVTYPASGLSLDPHTHHDTPSRTYELYGVCCHEGLPNFGHYTAYCKTQDSRWWSFDDAKVTQASLNQVLDNRNAHILFYQAVENTSKL